MTHEERKRLSPLAVALLNVLGYILLILCIVGLVEQREALRYQLTQAENAIMRERQKTCTYLIFLMDASEVLNDGRVCSYILNGRIQTIKP